MAIGVIFYHTFRLTDRPIAPAPVEQALQNLWVDGFFALSGFLIVGSWLRRPDAVPFLRHRILRIYPAFLVCLVLTAFAAVPLSVALVGGSYTVGDQLGYIAQNLGLYIRTYSVGGTLAGLPYPDVWNGSLWTLFWEFLCYLAVLAFGLAGILARRWGVPALFATSWVLALATVATPLGSVSLPLGTHAIGSLPMNSAGRFALAFAAGALIHRLQHHLVCRWHLIAVALVVVAAAMWLPDYRLVGALFLAYALIATGALIHRPMLHLGNDISYGMYIYAFPLQQLLIAAGLARLGVWPLAIVATLVTAIPATLSWFLVEKPAMRRKR